MTDTPTGTGNLIKRLFNLHNRMANMDGISNDDLCVILDAYDALEAAERVIDGIRPEVLAFAHLMERELRNNDHKGGWKDDSPDELARRVREEAQELYDVANSYDVACKSPVPAAAKDTVAGEAADVANMAMMVADVCGCLVATGQPSGFTPNPHESADDRRNRRISEGLRQDVTGQRKGGDDGK